MEKAYIKDGNSGKKGNPYCKMHFMFVHKREPNLMDKVSFRTCVKCMRIGPNEWD